MARGVHDVVRQTILKKYADTTADRPLETTTDKELFIKCTKTIETEVATEEIDRIRQKVFNFHSVRSVLLEKHKTKKVKKKTNQKCVNLLAMECYGRNGNKMSIRMYKFFF